MPVSSSLQPFHTCVEHRRKVLQEFGALVYQWKAHKNMSANCTDGQTNRNLDKVISASLVSETLIQCESNVHFKLKFNLHGFLNVLNVVRMWMNKLDSLKKVNYFVFAFLRLASLTNFTGSAQIVKRRFL